MMAAYSGLMMFALGIQKIFENMPKTIKGICGDMQKRHHYQHKVEKRMRRIAKGVK